MSDSFEIRIGGCVIPCKKGNVTKTSEVIRDYINKNPDAQFMNINLSHFNEDLDKDFVCNILNDAENVTLLPGRENFFRYFCTELEINNNNKNKVQISSIFNSNDSIKNLTVCEKKLLELTNDNFNSTLDFFKNNDESNFLNIDKYSFSHLLLNGCFARPFDIEKYMKFLIELSRFDQERVNSNGNTNEKNLFDVFMKCFSFELNEAFLSSADYQNIDELFFILRYFSDNSAIFNSLLSEKNYSVKGDINQINFLDLYYHGKYNMISFNSLKPLFVDRVSITEFDAENATEKYAEKYHQISEDKFIMHDGHAHEGINGDKLARLIFFDNSNELENALYKAYDKMKKNSAESNENENENEKSNQNSASSGSYISSLSYNNNYSIGNTDSSTESNTNKVKKFSLDNDYDTLARDIKIGEEDIEEISKKMKSCFRFQKSIYERCSFLNEGCTLLEYAAFRGSVRCFKMLLKHRLDNNDESNNNDEDPKNFKIDLGIDDSLANFAVAGGSTEIIDLIYELINKTKVDSESNPVSFSNTLETAIKFHQWDIAEKIFEENISNYQNKEIILNECIHYSNYKTLIYLIQNHLQMGDNFLLDCCRYGNFCIAKWALSFATKDVVNYLDDDTKMNILHYAVILDHKSLLSLILQHRKESQQNASCDQLNFGIGINTKTGRYYRNSTALHLAVEDNNYEFTKMILESGIFDDELPPNNDIDSENGEKWKFGPLNIEIKNMNSLTPFHIACKNGNFEIVKLFLDNESYNVDINAETNGVLNFLVFDKLTPLHLAVQSENVDIVKHLLQRQDIHINAKTLVLSLFLFHIDVFSE